MRKKVGILTFHRVLNYGALLQAFALKTSISELGAQTDIIDYRNDFLENLYKYEGYFLQRGVKNRIRYILYSRIEKEKRNRFEAFRQQYLGITFNGGYKKDELNKLNDQYDLFFTGSDQVWSPYAHKLDGTFFLDFVENPKKKYSYAASFGVDSIKKNYYGLYEKWLREFRICSVRERQGETLIQKILNVPVRIDVDPVLLLPKDKWENAFNFKEKKERYALIYSFGLTDSQKKMAYICYKAGMKIYIIGESIVNPVGVPCKFIGDLGPKEFAEMIYGASFVITNSFHGTALSIVYNIPFATEYLLGDSSKANSRLENIISETNLQERVLTENIDYDRMLNKQINWVDVNRMVERMRIHSIDYLRRSIYE